MSPNISTLERKVRRDLAKTGHRLEKTPARSWLRREYGVGYQVTRNNTVEFGAWNRPYQATLIEVQEWAAELEPSSTRATSMC